MREIELTRQRLDGHLHELEEKLPGGTTIRRVAGLAVGGGASTTVFWFVVRRLRKRRAKAQTQKPVVVNVLPDKMAKKMTKALEDGTWRPYAAAFGGAWVLFRMAELRQLRRMRMAMTAR